MTIQKILEEALGVPKIHLPRRAVKSDVARNFYMDGNLFIDRFDQVRHTESMNNRNFCAKAIVDLAMSMECSLKSAIICLSKDTETPAAAYKKARSLSHNLDKLYQEVANRARNRITLPRKDVAVYADLNSLGVSSRYAFELWLMRIQSDKSEVFLGKDFIGSTIDSEEWARKVRNEAVRLNRFAHQCHSKYLGKHAILSGRKFATYNRALKKFLDATA